MKTVLVILGTRPEAIKMCPLIKEIKKNVSINLKVLSTGQHSEMLDCVLEKENIEKVGLGNIIDCTEWSVRAYVLNYKGYDTAGDRLICYTNSTLGAFPRYTTEQVIALAEEELNGYLLPQELQEYYGID